MEKKTKALAAIAAGALAIGIALSVASCALRSAGTDQQTVQEEAPAEEAAQGQGAEAPAALTSYELACSKGWKSDAGSLQMSKGMVIEKGADGKIHVLTVSEVEEADAGKQAVLTVAGTDEDSQDSVIWTLIFDRSGGAATMSSDDFKVSKKYSEDVAEGSVSVSGMDEAYIGLVGGDAEPPTSPTPSTRGFAACCGTSATGSSEPKWTCSGPSAPRACSPPASRPCWAAPAP